MAGMADAFTAYLRAAVMMELGPHVVMRERVTFELSLVVCFRELSI